MMAWIVTISSLISYKTMETYAFGISILPAFTKRDFWIMTNYLFLSISNRFVA